MSDRLAKIRDAVRSLCFTHIPPPKEFDRYDGPAHVFEKGCDAFRWHMEEVLRPLLSDPLPSDCLVCGGGKYVISVKLEPNRKRLHKKGCRGDLARRGAWTEHVHDWDTDCDYGPPFCKTCGAAKK